MPRGGGSRGGGFRGGGFGGGFRGGGFRGGPASFRTGSIRSSGVPFGRTGASRVVSRPPSGPYRHGYYRPHRRYYWWGYRPWYWRWWYSPWWSGYWYRPWYYSPVYVGGGILFVIVLGLILLPLFGVGLWYPFTSADSSGTVNYRSTETLYYNEYWYEYEYIETGNDITFSVQSSPSLISFAIWDHPFENLPTTSRIGSYADSFNLVNNQYEYYWLFLNPSSTINYNFTADTLVDFFIADAYQLYSWNEGGSPNFYKEILNTTGNSGIFSISEANDYYLVWYNDLPGTVNIDFTVNYIAENVIDFSGAYEVEEAVDSTADTFSVPNSGNWYFFIYFDPFNSPEESTSITFDVTYDTGVTYADRWTDISWILIIGIVIIIIIIIVAFVARRSQKAQSLKPKKKEKPEIAAVKKETKETIETETEYCPRCGFNMRKDANFCPRCGAKVEGRSIGTSEIITPAEAETCSFCGSKLSESANYCPWCGTPKSQNE